MINQIILVFYVAAILVLCIFSIGVLAYGIFSPQDLAALHEELGCLRGQDTASKQF
jgi:hypothetical protein